MAKVLVVDIGNTRQKMLLYSNGKKRGTVRTSPPSDRKSLRKMISTTRPDLVFISSVHRKVPKPGGRVTVAAFTSSTPVPLKNKYRTKFTLGSDRLASAVGAAVLFPHKNVLVVDAGTCIKFNFVNKKGEYLGGSISPGIGMRFKALHNFTERLPLVTTRSQHPLTGSTTGASVRSGVINGAVEEVKGMINAYKVKYPGLVVVLTGGDASCFVKSLKMRIFAVPHLILDGLHEIFEFNVQKISG
ncbi:MAG: type III pantothenate kinase [Bacteroidia bacterium]|nr:type III pantothenate kinase [Bacteroidia bacterium]